MSLDSRSFSASFKGQIDRLKTVKITSSDIADKLKTTKITAADLTERMKKISASDFTGKMKKSMDQVSSYAKTVVEKAPSEKESFRGTVELNSRGYEVINIEDSEQVYIAQIPEKATFDDAEVIITRAEPGKFIGTSDETEAEEEVVVKKKADVDVESLFHKAQRGGTTEVPVTIGLNNDGVVEEYSAPSDGINVDKVYQDLDMDPIIIMRMDEEPVSEAPVVTMTPGISKIEVEPLTETVESTEMLGSADKFISKMTESALTSSEAEKLTFNPMEDEAYSKDALTQVKVKSESSRTPRFVFKDGKLQMVVPEEKESAFTVNRAVSVEDEVSGVMKLTIPDIEPFDAVPADSPYCIPDDGLESIPFPNKAQSGERIEKTESDCVKVRFDFENRNSDDGLVGFSF